MSGTVTARVVAEDAGLISVCCSAMVVAAVPSCSGFVSANGVGYAAVQRRWRGGVSSVLVEGPAWVAAEVGGHVRQNPLAVGRHVLSQSRKSAIADTSTTFITHRIASFLRGS